MEYRLTPRRWRNLTDRLYNKLYIHEWKKNYDAPHVREIRQSRSMKEEKKGLIGKNSRMNRGAYIAAVITPNTKKQLEKKKQQDPYWGKFKKDYWNGKK